MSSIAFDHIALGMPRIADAVPFLVGVLGGIPHSGMRGGTEFRFGTWRYSGGGKIEVIEPIGDDGFVSRFLAARGPGIHHVTFKVPSLDAACERARARGYDIVDHDDSCDDWKRSWETASSRGGRCRRLRVRCPRSPACGRCVRAGACGD